MTECAKCKTQTITVHVITLDNGRRTWLVCCLCAAELVGALDAKAVEA